MQARVANLYKRASSQDMRGFYIAFIVFAVLTFTLPIRRPLMNGVDTDLDGLVSYAFKLMPFIPIGAMVVIYYQHRYRNALLFKITDKLTSLKVLQPLAMFIMPVAIVMFVAGVPGIWWTWTTLALHFVTLVLIAGFLQDRLRSTSAFLVAGSIVTLGAGAWEIYYQTTLYLTYYAPQGVDYTGLGSAILFLYPMVVGGLAVMLEVWLKRPTTGTDQNIPPSLNKWSLTFLGVTVVALAMWHVTGFWVDVLYDLETETIYYQEGFNYPSMLAYKLSKVTLGLGLAFLYYRDKSKEEVLGV